MSQGISTNNTESAGGESLIVRRCETVSAELDGSDLHPLLKQVYANRGVTKLSQVDYSLNRLLDVSLFKDIDTAAEIVAEAIINRRNILVVGDFDVDGATSTAVVIRALKAFGAETIDHLVPNRFDFGYGLSPQLVDVAITLEAKPDIIITVDNGISSIDGVAHANDNNIKVVVTDHHLAGNVLPDAAAIVNPNQPGCRFPEKSIAGVGVAFYLMLAVRAVLRDRNWYENRQEPNMAVFLDLVALGTVADVVPLDSNNRILVEFGLQRIRANRGCAGINALLTIAGKSIEQCSAQDFGFAIGPRLNAAGRLEDMSLGIECLLTDDHEKAINLASQLDQINHQRRSIESDMLEQATQILQAQLTCIDKESIPSALSLYEKEWHQGVVGLLASRLKEAYHRPVIAFATAGNGELKGSGRSIPGLHMRDVLDIIAKLHPGIVIKFGGHAMAAGLTIYEKDFATFQSAFAEQVAKKLTEDDLRQVRFSDGPVSAQHMKMQTCELFRFSSPWGQHFPEPIFDDVFEIHNWRIVGEKHLKLELCLPETGELYSAIAFNKTDADLPAGSRLARMLFQLDINEFRGNRELQLIINHIECA